MDDPDQVAARLSPAARRAFSLWLDGDFKGMAALLGVPPPTSARQARSRLNKWLWRKHARTKLVASRVVFEAPPGTGKIMAPLKEQRKPRSPGKPKQR